MMMACRRADPIENETELSVRKQHAGTAWIVVTTRMDTSEVLMNLSGGPIRERAVPTSGSGRITTSPGTHHQLLKSTFRWMTILDNCLLPVLPEQRLHPGSSSDTGTCSRSSIPADWRSHETRMI